MAFSSALCGVLPAANATLRRFDARYFTLDFPITSIATIVADTPDFFQVNCEFRSNRDLVGILWNSKDKYGHPLLQYLEDRNYTGTVLAFCANPVDPYNFTVTIEADNGATVYRMYPYKVSGAMIVPDAVNPSVNGPGPGINYSAATIFPAGVTVPAGHQIYILDFDDLRAGFNYEKPKINPGVVRQLFFSVVPAQYGLSNTAMVANAGVLRGKGTTPGEVVVVSVEAVQWWRITGVSPDLRLTRGDKLLLSLGVPTNPQVGSKGSVSYTLESQNVDITVNEWTGDGTTERLLKLPGDGLKDVAWLGGKVISMQLAKDTPIGSVVVPLAFSSISVTGARVNLQRRLYPQPAHNMQMTTGFDDTYNITPWRQIDNVYNLGYRNFYTIYMGMSHYFKASSFGGFTSYQNKVIEAAEETVNYPTEHWCRSFFTLGHARGYVFIWSTSYEILNTYMPEAWAQKDYLGRIGLSGWVPPSGFLIPVHPAAMSYLARTIKNGLKLLSESGAVDLRFQIGEPWWWDGSYSNGAPAIYDAFTTALYTSETGSPVPAPFYSNYLQPITPLQRPYLEWLGLKLGQSTNFIRDTVKAVYPTSKATLLFFTPQIMNPTAEMLTIINFPKSEWVYPNYEFVQIEDYDWIIDSKLSLLPKTLEAAVDVLGYPLSVVQYFVGFVLTAQETWVWPNINIATREAKIAGIPNIAIWAYTQVIRDGILYNDALIATTPAVQPPVPARRQVSLDIGSRVVRPVFFCKIGDDLRMNSSDRNIVLGGETWYATSQFGKVTPLVEGLTTPDSGWQMSLGAIPLHLLEGVVAGMRTDKVELQIGLVDAAGALVDVPRKVGAGRIFSNAVTVENNYATVTLSVRSGLAAWHRTNSARYTDEAQQLINPADRGMKFMTDLPYRKLKWGDQNA